jgi:IS5 family transposase
MLCIYCLQQWYNLSGPGAENALYDIQSTRAFCGLDLGRDPIPDAPTILNFHHLLERHELTKGNALSCLRWGVSTAAFLSRGALGTIGPALTFCPICRSSTSRELPERSAIAGAGNIAIISIH